MQNDFLKFAAMAAARGMKVEIVPAKINEVCAAGSFATCSRTVRIWAGDRIAELEHMWFASQAITDKICNSDRGINTDFEQELWQLYKHHEHLMAHMNADAYEYAMRNSTYLHCPEFNDMLREKYHGKDILWLIIDGIVVAAELNATMDAYELENRDIDFIVK